MLSVLIEGLLTADPVRRVAANGKPYTTANLRAAGVDGESILCNLIAFDADAGHALAELAAGDPVAVVGHAGINQWAGKDGQRHVGLKVTVTRVLSVYAAGHLRKAAAWMVWAIRCRRPLHGCSDLLSSVFRLWEVFLLRAIRNSGFRRSARIRALIFANNYSAQRERLRGTRARSARQMPET